MNRVLAFFRGKGFYLALMACILAAALCSFWAIRTVTQQLGSKDEVLPGGDDTWNLPGESVEQKVEETRCQEACVNSEQEKDEREAIDSSTVDMSSHVVSAVGNSLESAHEAKKDVA